jgi:hypothetical protein
VEESFLVRVICRNDILREKCIFTQSGYFFSKWTKLLNILFSYAFLGQKGESVLTN